MHNESIQRVFDRLERVSDWQLFAFCMLWVIGGGLSLQFIFLPYVVPHAHWGHGLIAGQDSVGFHLAAVETAHKIRVQGWSAWELTPVNYSIALASAIYAVTYPEPWVVLPVNGALFGIVIVAVRRLLAVTFDSRATGLVGVTPFFVFPSFVPIWGQLHRDLNTGAGLSLVLCGLVLAAHKRREAPGILRCSAIALAGVGLIWLSRSYALAIVAAGTVVFAAVALLTRGCERVRVSVVALVVVLAAMSSTGSWTTRMLPPAGTPAAATEVQTPVAAASVPRGRDSCLPVPGRDIVDRLLYNLCFVREGFVVDSRRFQAGSGYDYEIRLRTARDFIAYGPRAVQVALLEPGPRRWMTETTPVGKLGSYFVPFEMLATYSCLLLAVLVAPKRVARLEVYALVAFCLTYTLFYTFVVAQLGTLYRMRAFALAIVVSTALAALVAQLKARE